MRSLYGFDSSRLCDSLKVRIFYSRRVSFLGLALHVRIGRVEDGEASRYRERRESYLPTQCGLMK